MTFTELGVPTTGHPLKGTLGDFADITIAIDEHQNDKGWDDHPPVLFVLFPAADDAEPDIVLDDGLAVTVERTRLGMVRHPREEIAALAHHARDAADGKPHTRGIMTNMYPRAPLAHLFTIEAWGTTSTADESLWNADGTKKNRDDPRMIADLPGSVELRWTFCVHHEHEIAVFRQRGSAPRLLYGDDVTAWGGNILDALRALHGSARALHNPLFGGTPKGGQ